MTTVTVDELLDAVSGQVPEPIGYSDEATITVRDGRIAIQVKPGPPDPIKVDLRVRLTRVLGLGVLPGQLFGSLMYRYNRGYETAVANERGGYSGVHHPDDACEGHLVCIYCGCVLRYE